MDWLLSVPLLLFVILLVMKVSDEEFSCKAWTLRLRSALLVVSGSYGGLVVTGDTTPRWICWFVPILLFCYIVHELPVGLATATAQEADPEIRSRIQITQVVTVISWCTYPIVYIFPTMSVAIDADQYVFQNYKSGTITSCCGTNLDHSVLAAGYDSTAGYYLVKNSWQKLG